MATVSARAGLRKRHVAVSAAAGLAVAAALGVPALAAGGYTVGAPYSGASHSSVATCPWPDVAPHCATAAAADAGQGMMRAAAGVDSGAGGTLPGAGESDAVSRISQVVDLGGASTATVAIHVHISGVTTSSTGLGKTYVYVSAGATCAQCADSQPYQFVDSPEDVVLELSIDRAGSAGSRVPLAAVLHVMASVDCDQVFCIAPTGTARAAASATLTRIEVRPR